MKPKPNIQIGSGTVCKLVPSKITELPMWKVPSQRHQTERGRNHTKHDADATWLKYLKL